MFDPFVIAVIGAWAAFTVAAYVAGVFLGYRGGKRVVTVKTFKDSRVVDDNVWESYKLYRWLEKGSKEPLHEAIKRQMEAAEAEGWRKGSKETAAMYRGLDFEREVYVDHLHEETETLKEEIETYAKHLKEAIEERNAARADCETVANFAREAGLREGRLAASSTNWSDGWKRGYQDGLAEMGARQQSVSWSNQPAGERSTFTVSSAGNGADVSMKVEPYKDVEYYKDHPHELVGQYVKCVGTSGTAFKGWVSRLDSAGDLVGRWKWLGVGSQGWKDCVGDSRGESALSPHLLVAVGSIEARRRGAEG